MLKGEQSVKEDVLSQVRYVRFGSLADLFWLT